MYITNNVVFENAQPVEFLILWTGKLKFYTSQCIEKPHCLTVYEGTVCKLLTIIFDHHSKLIIVKLVREPVTNKQINYFNDKMLYPPIVQSL